jgi:hypothetical protein
MATTLNLVVYAGDTYEHGLTWKHQDELVDLTDWTGQGEVKDEVGGDLLATFSVVKLDAVNGEFMISLTATQTEALAAYRTAVWDVQWTHSDGRVRTPAAGQMVIRRDVTET